MMRPQDCYGLALTLFDDARQSWWLAWQGQDLCNLNQIGGPIQQTAAQIGTTAQCRSPHEPPKNGASSDKAGTQEPEPTRVRELAKQKPTTMTFDSLQRGHINSKGDIFNFCHFLNKTIHWET